MPLVDLGPVKRFGVRYGRTPKYKLAVIETEQKARKPCPTCRKKTVKRLSAGVFQCSTCNVKFTGKAYTFEDKTAKEIIEETVEELKETVKEKTELEE